MAGTNGYVLVLPDKVASQLPGEKIRLVMKLADGGYPELRSELRQFLNSGEWLPDIQPGQELPEKMTMGILSCSVLAFEQLSSIDKNRKNYAVIDRLGVSSQKQVALIRKELSTVFFIPLLFTIILTVFLIAGTQLLFGKSFLQEGLVLFYGMVTILLFCAIYLTYFGATMFLFKKVILRPKIR